MLKKLGRNLMCIESKDQIRASISPFLGTVYWMKRNANKSTKDIKLQLSIEAAQNNKRHQL